jgi:Transport and Golgi organisation 2
MCTATWVRDEEGYQLFFNRDEKLTRKRETAPRLLERDGVRFIAPADGDFGGTWLAVNEFGVSICLLNGANLTRSIVPSTGQRSRGFVIPEIIAGESSTAVRARIQRLDFSRFSAFTIAILDFEATTILEWKGVSLTWTASEDSHLPITSSSFDTAAVRQERRQDFDRLLRDAGLINPELLHGFHSSHNPARGPYSVCMHRDDAETVSFTRIRVTRSRASVLYHPGAPCKTTGDTSITHLQLTRPRRDSATANI